MNPKHSRLASQAFVFFLILFALVAAAPVFAQDAVTVGTVTATGNTVDVPVYVRDVSGTPLGRDQAAGSKIQSFSITVDYSPAAAVQSVTFTRAGITAALSTPSEGSPGTSGTITWFASFDESTNLVPFTLNAPPPGDQIAHLVFTLSPSAAPGSTITLALGSGTVLSNQAGTIGETSPGSLTLVNGAINIPNLTLAIVPNSRVIEVNGSTTYTVQTSSNVGSNTTVTLTSSNPGIASMPASVDIAAGSHSANFNVFGSAVGAATITATLPAGAGGANATAELTVNPATTPCTIPTAPQISAPATANTGTPYSVSWAAVSSATDYVIDESTDANFLTVTSTNVNATSTSFTHAAANRYYYRVRARNQSTGCNTASLNSNAVSVLVIVAPVAQTRVLPVVGSVPGNFGAYFKTSVQLYNPKSTAVSGKIVFHTQAVSGSASDPSLAYSIPAGKSLSYADLLPAMGIASGLGSADIVADAGSPFPVLLARVFNDAGAAGTTGLALEPMAASDALQNGDSGVLIAPADTHFRLNIGVRTLEQGVGFDVTVRNKDGVVVKTTSKSFGPTFFRQIGSTEILDGYVLAGGETITIQITSGSAFVYGSTTDNTTQDPSVQFAKKVE
ncbi:MAG: hypothetical protein JO093_00120 [Acidobacteria bacterium]|nr:hypothetical protein [Acidobacteriota bacterium]MBV9067100.1 hypothetical protein [Acidobacteriota bacterium]MBV9183988.1 hypothetical protein [Acidobacteriota bacterium]